MCLQREFNEPHYSAIVGKHGEDSNLNYQRLNGSLLNSTQSSKVSSQGLVYPTESKPIKNESS